MAYRVGAVRHIMADGEDVLTIDSLAYPGNRASLRDVGGSKIAYPQEIAFRMGFIGAAGLEPAANRLSKSDYGAYVRRVGLSMRF
jgi:dTDP-glucose pyrophosphorylase